MQNKQEQQATINGLETTTDLETLGGLSVRTDLRAGISIGDIQDQVSGWWESLSSSLSLPGIDLSGPE